MSNIGHSVGPTEPFWSATKIAPFGKYDGIVFEKSTHLYKQNGVSIKHISNKIMHYRISCEINNKIIVKW